jgi:hypothetical protein
VDLNSQTAKRMNAMPIRTSTTTAPYTVRLALGSPPTDAITDDVDAAARGALTTTEFCHLRAAKSR